MAEVRLAGITKRFGKAEILKGIDLTVHDGEFFTFVGPSGCGKSTLLHLVAGLETLTGGEIYFDGHLISHLPPRDRDVALVFQSYALYPHMTVYENLAFPLRMKKQTSVEIDRQVRKVVELLGLTSVLSHKPQSLSGGQRQRVALGRAIVRQPKVFLFDEPLSNLDAQLRIEMRSELKKLHQSLKATMIYVTHDQAEAMTLSDRMVVLHQGVIHQCGTPIEIYDRPINLFVAGFMGSPSMNLLSVSLTPAPTSGIHLGENIYYELSTEVVERVKAGVPDGRMIMGVRPEHVRPVRVKVPKARMAQVILVEPMGSEAWLEVVWAGNRIKLKAPPDLEVKIGETIYVEIDEKKVHFFNVTTGARIS
jgi:multiple sugar transport system ATP-binding protein